jgi:uncharacterized protein (UPF0303 family)
MTDEEILERVAQEERELRFAEFDYEDAWALGTSLVVLARERAHPIAIAIGFGRQRVFHAALIGSSADNDAWIDRKMRSVEHFGTASLAVGARFRSRGRDFATHSGLDPREYSTYGGAFPLRVGGRIVGVVGVSGLSEADDHALVVEALTSLKSRVSDALAGPTGSERSG